MGEVAGLDVDGKEVRKVSPSSPVSVEHRPSENLQHRTVKE